jgi:hypothetical protein
MGLFDLMEPLHGNPAVEFVLIFHIAIAVLILIVISTLGTLLTNTLSAPTPPKGWGQIDYDANQRTRDSLVNYMAANNLPVDSTPMNQFSVATANFGGIFTESISTFSPWIGSVSGDASRLQVEAGARALTLDIWPDPADRQTPIVASMVDTQEWSMQNTWMKWGLDRGVGRYSNWQHLTRNKKPVGEILKPALTAAFSASPGPQNTDPFFLILRLHGSMTTDYLNHLGRIVQDAIGGNAMGAEWNKCLNQKSICTAPVVQFLSKVFVIVLPDIQPGYNSLPNINTYAGFTTAFLTTRLGEITNAMEQTPNTIAFEPSGIAAVSATGQSNCTNPSGPQQSLAQTGFCVVQPSIGGQTTDNSQLFSGQGSYTACLQSGAQFVAINLFSPNATDGPLNTFFDPKYFGTFSFRKI